MKTYLPTRKQLLMQLIVAALLELPCGAHNENVHRYITRSAFYSSSGLNAFLSDNLNPNPHLITAQPHGYNASENQLPETWLEWGAYYEDMEDPITWQAGGILGTLDSPRAQDHFHTVTFQPTRSPGQVIGLTDSSEHFLSPWGTNSFAWAAIKGVRPVADVKPNDQTWPASRSCEFAALTNAFQTTREENLALMLDSLGHVLHLNQDLTSPDHVRNDNHYNETHRYIENYGQQDYLNNLQWFNQQPHGWPYWQTQGFSKLLDYWDTGKYANGNSDALVQETAGNTKLGLAEFSNGNFLGEDALYNEVVPASDSFHHFPFPSLNSSTTFLSVRSQLSSGMDTSFLKDGTPIQRIYLNKTADGVSVTHHSVLNYLGAVYPRKSGAITKVSVTINDLNVLQDYHSILIPKAVEYSAGLLDYFFRGQLAVSIGLDTNTGQYTFTNSNASGQSFLNGTFFLYQQDTNQNRILLQQANLAGTLANGDSFTMACTKSVATNADLFMIYQGTIGVTNGSASDPVDAGIAIAVKKFGIYLYANEAETYWTCKRTLVGDIWSSYQIPAGIVYSLISVMDANDKAYDWARQLLPTGGGCD